MARPKLKIDPIEVRKLSELGCKTTEMASFFGCSTDTLERRYAAELEKGRSNLRISLRRWQLQAAQRGNVTMMIWLGKQMLGQMERSQIDLRKIDDETFLEEAKRRLGDGSEQSTDSKKSIDQKQ